MKIHLPNDRGIEINIDDVLLTPILQTHGIETEKARSNMTTGNIRRVYLIESYLIVILNSIKCN